MFFLFPSLHSLFPLPPSFFSPSPISLCLSVREHSSLNCHVHVQTSVIQAQNVTVLYKNAFPPFLPPPPTAFPLTLVLSITIPVGTVLVAVVLLLLCLCCVLCLRRHAQIGKHTPLMEEHAFEKQKKKKKLRQKT